MFPRDKIQGNLLSLEKKPKFSHSELANRGLGWERN